MAEISSFTRHVSRGSHMRKKDVDCFFWLIRNQIWWKGSVKKLMKRLILKLNLFYQIFMRPSIISSHFIVTYIYCMCIDMFYYYFKYKSRFGTYKVGLLCFHMQLIGKRLVKLRIKCLLNIFITLGKLTERIIYDIWKYLWQIIKNMKWK